MAELLGYAAVCNWSCTQSSVECFREGQIVVANESYFAKSTDSASRTPILDPRMIGVLSDGMSTYLRRE